MHPQDHPTPSPAPRPTPHPARPERLDQALVARHLAESREKAQRLILAGAVLLNHQRADKPGRRIRPSDHLEVQAQDRYVSRGGHKLEHALQTFHIQPTGWSAADLGASTGGFTDCLLQHGAARVFAIDVGRGQLAWKLRQDPRVVVMEGVNARHLLRTSFPTPFTPFNLITADCSFIALEKILPAAVELLAPSGIILALVKPQFQAGKAEADRGAGVITDPAIHERVLRELAEFVNQLPGCRWRDAVESPLLGPAGNKEFLALIERSP